MNEVTYISETRTYMDGLGGTYTYTQLMDANNSLIPFGADPMAFSKLQRNYAAKQGKPSKKGGRVSPAPKGKWNAGDIAKEILTDKLMGVTR